MNTRARMSGFAAVAILALASAPASSQGQNWVAAWSTSQQGLSQAKLSNASVRMIARVTIPGDQVRVRLDNTFGKTPVTFAHATIGPRVRGPALALGLIKPVTFGGKATVTVPAGGPGERDAGAMLSRGHKDGG